MAKNSKKIIVQAPTDILEKTWLQLLPKADLQSIDSVGGEYYFKQET